MYSSCFQFIFTATAISLFVEITDGFPLQLWLIIFIGVSPLITFVVNEIVKYQEIQ